MYREVLNDVEQLVNAQENKLDEEAGAVAGKASRSKDKRLSTTSDRGVVMATGGGNMNDNESVESEQMAANGPVVKAGRKASYTVVG